MTGRSGRTTRAGDERVSSEPKKKKEKRRRFASRDDDAHSFLARGVETATEVSVARLARH